MDVTPLIPAGRRIIQGYGDGGFRIGGERFEGSVLLFPTRVTPWPAAEAGQLTPGHFAALAGCEEPRVEILLLGTGAEMPPLPVALRGYFKSLGIAFEAMDTGAACRTYNVLLAEERRVAAALLAV